jgi:osmotically-inducible protein OsmY
MKKYFVLCLLVLTQTACPALILGGAAKVGSVVAEERSVGSTVDDTAIWTHIKSLYLQKNVDYIYATVNVEVNEGRVLLTGTVDNPEHRVEAVRLAWQPVGVKEVINELQITDKSSIADDAKDYWINTRVNANLLVEKNVRSINYNTDTINGVVYLIGIAQNEWEMKQAALVASKVKGVKRVVSYVRVKQNPSDPPAPAKQKAATSDNPYMNQK